MNTTNQVFEALKGGPLNKATITETIGIKGLPLFNLLKQMVKDGQLTIAGEGNDTVYSIPATAANETTVSPAIEVTPESQVTPFQDTLTETQPERPVPPAEVKAEGNKDDVPVVTKATPRNNDKFSFNGVSDLGKGALARSIVMKFVADNPNTIYKKLLEVFPPTLLKRFGVVEDIEKAREISGNKYDRYFFKEEHVIKLKDKKVVVTNQWTSDNLIPLLQVAREKLGYTIN